MRVRTNRWRTFTLEEKIDAVIHDGQWWTIDKWAKLAGVKNNEIYLIENYIKENPLLIKNGKSYRYSADEVLRWYEEKGFPIELPLVPRNFPPRIWQGKTEVEHFLNKPRTRLMTVTIKVEDETLRNKIIDILLDYGQVKEKSTDELLHITMNADYIVDLLKTKLSPTEYDSISLRLKTEIHRRDLTDFDEASLQYLLKFYYDYAIVLLKQHKKTMEIFLPEHSDRKTKVHEWICEAIQKYNEKANTPFPAYIAVVLMSWPYDLPAEKLGKELALYQRQRAKAIKEYEKLHETQITTEELYERLSGDYDRDTFLDLENQHHIWIKSENPDSMFWDKKGNEKKISDEYEVLRKSTEVDYENNRKITASLLYAGLKTKNYSLALSLLNSISHGGTDLSIMEKVGTG